MTTASELTDAIYRITAPTHDVRPAITALIEAAMTPSGLAAEHLKNVREALLRAPRRSLAWQFQLCNPALAALDAIAARVAELDANALPLEDVPGGWAFDLLAARKDASFRAWLMRPQDDGSRLIIAGAGPTPAAALRDAIATASGSAA